MNELVKHDIASGPERSKPLLQSSIDGFGFIPNQSAYMANSPALLKSYQLAHDEFGSSTLTDTEKAVVWITCGTVFNCEYTISAHTFIALSQGVDNDVIKKIKEAPEALDSKNKVLAQFVRKVIFSSNEKITRRDCLPLIENGFTNEQVLDAILGVSQKFMSINLNSIANPQIDEKFGV